MHVVFAHAVSLPLFFDAPSPPRGKQLPSPLQAIVLGWLIGYFDNEKAASWEGWVYACAVVLSGALFR